ncbi:hypothetical protein Tco_0097828 [Tanacetum coccineum]
MQEVNMVVEEEAQTWMTSIQNYLEKGMLPKDPVDARTLMEKIGNYTLEDGVHRTMKKTSNGKTPFNLTYGTEAVIPIEIGMSTHQTSKLNEKTNDQELRLNLNLLEEQREIAAIREAKYKEQVEKYYKKRCDMCTSKWEKLYLGKMKHQGQIT